MISAETVDHQKNCVFSKQLLYFKALVPTVWFQLMVKPEQNLEQLQAGETLSQNKVLMLVHIRSMCLVHVRLPDG